MNTLKYILEKFNLNLEAKSPLIIQESRWKTMPKLYKELGFKVGAEIGVLKGRFTKAFLSQGIKMYGIDPWEYYKTYNDFRDQKILDECKAEATKRLKGYKDCIIIEKWSKDAVKNFKDKSLDFVFLDGNHALEYVIEDIANWSKKVRKGGIISGHDYFRPKHSHHLMHVKDAVNTWVYVYKIKHWFLFKGDKCPSWFWVKE